MSEGTIATIKLVAGLGVPLGFLSVWMVGLEAFIIAAIILAVVAWVCLVDVAVDWLCKR